QTNLIGLNAYLHLEGSVYKLKPYKTDGMTPEMSRKYLLEKFEYTTLNDPEIQKDKNARALSVNYLAAFARLAQFYFQKEQNEEVCTILNEMTSKLPKEIMHFNSYKTAISFATFFHRAECPFDYYVFLTAVDPGLERTMNDYVYIERFYIEIVKDKSKADETFQQLLKIAESSDLKLLQGYYEKKDFGGNRLEQIAKLIDRKVSKK
ncbi:MAG: hypothetical protein ACW99F_14520, partial [Candidatus Hodarchaeales archaeon]